MWTGAVQRGAAEALGRQRELQRCQHFASRQPRDGNPAACYAMFDDETLELTYYRVPYDHDAAAQRIRDAGLPPRQAERLLHGR